MPNLGVTSFNTGRVTPLIDVGTRLAKYSAACRICDNMIPLIYGPATRRPGTRFIANVDDDNVKSKMVRFVFSSAVAYKLEFGDQIIKVYFNDDLIDTVTSPYLEADLFQLQFRQSADVMWITHSSYKPRKFSRVSVTEFTLASIVFENGPFIERNDIENDDGVTIAVAGLTIATASTGGGVGTDNFTIEGDDNADATDIGALFSANQRFYVDGSTGNDSAYTVHATVATTVVGTTVTIFANEAISNGIDDGEIMVDGGTVTLTASGNIFESGHIDALFKITHKRVQTAVKGNVTTTGVVGEAIDVKGTATLLLTGNFDAVIELQRLEDGTNWETFDTFVSTISNGVGSATFQKTFTEEADGVQFRVNVTEYTAGTVVVVFTVSGSTQDSIFRISTVPTASSATAIAIIAAPDNVAATRWAEGSWSGARGYPTSITFYEERAVYGFTNLDQQGVWLSETGRFEDFEAGLKAGDSFAINIPTAERGRWLASLETLAAGTAGGEWRVRATTLDAALTPTNFDIKQQTNWGSTEIQAMEVNEAILFVDAVARKVREYTFVDQQQKYVAPDLTALAEDITLGGITSAAVQTRPDSIIWFTLATSPYLISLTYEREQDVVAWAAHPLGGDGIAESIIVTPGDKEDVVTLTVKRTINGNTVRFIEEMQLRDWGTNNDNAYFPDAGVIDTGGDVTIEIPHLEGEEVGVLVDGAVQASKTVANGIITIDEPGDIVHAGLLSTYQLSPMRMDRNTQTGTTHGSIQVVPTLVVSLFKSGGVSYGDGDDQTAIDFRIDEPFGDQPALFTGDMVVTFDAGFNIDGNIVISGTTMLPCTVRAIIARTEKTGR